MRTVLAFLFFCGATSSAFAAALGSGTADGPLLFMKLPPGRYEVVADFDGKEQHRSVQVGPHGGRLVALLW